MQGKCLCGNIEFEILNGIPNFYQCHCSLCQKATGSSSCSSFITSTKNINWIKGNNLITSYTNKNGVRSNFCSLCGSPVPNEMTSTNSLNTCIIAQLANKNLKGFTPATMGKYLAPGKYIDWQSPYFLKKARGLSQGLNNTE
ncbi:MAG: GFA family protein [Gammaproteobacteria bacterium]|nr:GFA family protein [Gammaproteobacteria bacterium]MCW8986031.1 GFA family protein [Gammaproteobacteria bacterium]